MKILFVLNNIFCQGNGLDASARRTVKALRDAGQEVRVLSCENLNDPNGPQPEYRLKEFIFPIFQPLIKAQGYSFAKWKSPVIEEAIRWAFTKNNTTIVDRPGGLGLNSLKEMVKNYTGSLIVVANDIVFDVLQNRSEKLSFDFDGTSIILTLTC